MPIKHKLQLEADTQENHFCSFFKFTLLQCLLPCASYSFSAEYSVAFSCRIFVFGRSKKIRFRSITSSEVQNKFPTGMTAVARHLYLHLHCKQELNNSETSCDKLTSEAENASYNS
jgi:hypothetical protein